MRWRGRLAADKHPDQGFMLGARNAGRRLTDRQPFEPGEDEGDAGELAVTGAVRVIRQTDIKGMPYIEYRVVGVAGLWSGSGERKVPGRQLTNSEPSISHAF